MEVKKQKTDFGYNITLIEDSKRFSILFGGNLDLYFIIKNLENKEEMTYETFVITKENMFIYTLFERLFYDIKSCNVYKSDEYNNIDRLNVGLKRSEEYKKLFDGSSITWISDDDDYKQDQMVRITKQNEAFVLEFIVSFEKKEEYWMDRPSNTSISIRFRNSGSKYNPFNVIFMNLYNSLCNYNPEFHQIHIEEIEYQKTHKFKK